MQAWRHPDICTARTGEAHSFSGNQQGRIDICNGIWPLVSSIGEHQRVPKHHTSSAIYTITQRVNFAFFGEMPRLKVPWSTPGGRFNTKALNGLKSLTFWSCPKKAST